MIGRVLQQLTMEDQKPRAVVRTNKAAGISKPGDSESLLPPLPKDTAVVLTAQREFRGIEGEDGQSATYCLDDMSDVTPQPDLPPSEVCGQAGGGASSIWFRCV